MYTVTDVSNQESVASILRDAEVIPYSRAAWTMIYTTHGVRYSYRLVFHNVDEWSLESLDAPIWRVRFLVTRGGVSIGIAQQDGRTYTCERFLKKYSHICMVARVLIKNNRVKL